ncbi:unnamed protein product [Diamesa serratosioi]
MSSNQNNGFSGFSENEIKKITVNKSRKAEVIKVQKKIPTPKLIPKDENENRIKTPEIPVLDITEENLKQIRASIKFQPNVIIENDVEEVNGIEEKSERIYKGISLENFEFQRKMMEEQNKQKRNLLQQAISKYSEKTQAETKKLQEIKYELDKLDSELAADVAILRKQIETASFQFNNIEKHYNSVERIFLKAKQDLYHAHEKKDMLTEHLYTIIAHNEDRKAKKLSDLMEKVGISLSDEDILQK